MADDDYEYEKEFVLLNLVDTDLPGLYVVEVSDKIVLQQVEVGGGDKDLVRAKFGVGFQDETFSGVAKSRQMYRRKVYGSSPRWTSTQLTIVSTTTL